MPEPSWWPLPNVNTGTEIFSSSWNNIVTAIQDLTNSHNHDGTDSIGLSGSAIATGNIAAARMQTNVLSAIVNAGGISDAQVASAAAITQSKIAGVGTDAMALLAAAQTPTNKTLGSGTVFGANPNFNEQQALSFRVENLTSLPAAGNLGRVVFRTSDNTLWYDNGTAFIQLNRAANYSNSESTADTSAGGGSLKVDNCVSGTVSPSTSITLTRQATVTVIVGWASGLSGSFTVFRDGTTSIGTVPATTSGFWVFTDSNVPAGTHTYSFSTSGSPGNGGAACIYVDAQAR